MKRIRLYGLLVLALLSLMSLSVMAQEAAPQPSAGTTFDYHRDRVQYEGSFLASELGAGQDAPVAQEPVSDFAPPTSELMPCPVNVTAGTVCDMIATQPEDIVGVWSLYFQSQPAFIRYNLDGTWVLGNSVESTSDLNSASASGPYSFDDAGIFTTIFTGAPLDVVPQECQAGQYVLRVIMVGGQPVALNHMAIEDCFVNRETDWRYTMVRVSAE